MIRNAAKSFACTVAGTRATRLISLVFSVDSSHRLLPAPHVRVTAGREASRLDRTARPDTARALSLDHRPAMLGTYDQRRRAPISCSRRHSAAPPLESLPAGR